MGQDVMTLQLGDEAVVVGAQLVSFISDHLVGVFYVEPVFFLLSIFLHPELINVSLLILQTF